MSVIHRVKKMDFIKKWILCLEDNDINKIYEILKMEINNLDCENDNRPKKIVQISDNLGLISDSNLVKICKIVVDMMELENKEIDKDDLVVNKIKSGLVDKIKKNEKNEIKETKDEKMRRVMLEIINKILVLMDKDEIKDLQDVNFDRDILREDRFVKLLDDNKEYIFSNEFNKHQCQIYQTRVKNSHISMLKGMLKQVGYTLFSKNQKKMTKGVYESHTIYFVKRNE